MSESKNVEEVMKDLGRRMSVGLLAAKAKTEQGLKSAAEGAKEVGAMMNENWMHLSERTIARFKMEGEIQAAIKILRAMTNPDKIVSKDVEEKIPLKILQRAKGLAFITEVKAGFLFAGKGGTGIVIARLPDGKWSGPSAVATMSVSAGLMVGVSKSAAVIVLGEQAAIDSFAGKGQLKLGVDVEVTAGPVGRDVGGALRASGEGYAPTYAYSHTTGAYVGLSIDSAVLLTQERENTAFYGSKVSAKDVLSGRVAPPADCTSLQELIALLNEIDGKPSTDQAIGPDPVGQAPA